ncbi:helix-turn-helix domain-containing protein [Kitasatospora sp. NPDC018058]|uniref:helix-turn-helix domain-containing protein n=1 Tax=Kitasatospora sp. NPDC018058 TaxID=3364025 RepID=UPI0037C0DD2D
MLNALGLDQASERIYRAMLGNPHEDLNALLDRLELPEEEVRGALDRLSELALVRRRPDDPSRYRVVDPEVGIEVLIASRRAHLAEEQQRIEQARLAAMELIQSAARQRRRPEQRFAEQLGHLDEIRDRINMLCRNVTREVMTFAPGGGQSAANMEAAKPQDRELLERGVRMRTLYLDSVRNSPATVAYAKWLAELGGEVRTVPALPTRLMILDRTTAVLPVDTENTGSGAALLTGQGTLVALCALFDLVWERAVPLYSAAPREHDEHGLSPQEAEALRLLGQGHTDETIAKRLGVSARTARRIAADLMETLGARSRFQAGAKAVANGWLTGEE